jgi:hypothetical protein
MRPAVVLIATIAVAAAAGTAVSLTQRPPAAGHHATASPSPGVSLAPPANQPAVAFGFALAADLASHQLVLFGGVADFDNTWLWNGAAWSRAHPAASPPGRYGASAAFDPAIGEVLLFGGTLQTGPSTNDTWAWDSQTWTEVDAGRNGPTAGGGSAMAWDPARSEMVLVTPSPAGGGGAETWTWSGAKWVRDPAGNLGTSDAGILIAYEPLSSALLAQGCCRTADDAALAHRPSTWRWDGSHWAPLTTSAHPPDGSSLQEDPSIKRLVLCSCDLEGGLAPALWVWNGTDWIAGAYPPPPVAPEAAVVDPSDSQFLLLGAAISGVDALVQTVEVWTLRGTHWLRLGTGFASG